MEKNVSRKKGTIFTISISALLFVLIMYIISVINIQISNSNKEFFSADIERKTRVINHKAANEIEIVENFVSEAAQTDIMDDELALEYVQEYSGKSYYRMDNILVYRDDTYISAMGYEYPYIYDYVTVEKAFLGQSNISSPMNVDYYDTKLYMISVPIRSASGNVEAVFCSAVRIDLLENLATENVYGNKIRTLIVDADGNLIDQSNNSEAPMTWSNLFMDCTIKKPSEENLMSNLAFRQNNGTMKIVVDSKTCNGTYIKLNNSDWYLLEIYRDNRLDIFTNTAIVAMVVIALGLAAVIVVMSVKLGRSTNGLMMSAEKLETEMFNLMNVDELTGFDSYHKFLETAHELVSKNTQTKYAMLAMDINNFRVVNDLLGYEQGNAILVKISSVINRNIGEMEAFSRSAADSFMILIKYDNDRDIIEKVQDMINDSYYQITEFRLIMAFGIYKISDRNTDIRVCIDRADLARRVVKNSNESSFAFFDSFMLSKIREEKEIENVMEEALDSKEFVVYLQPKYDLQKDFGIIGAEALVRWMRDGKMIPPGDFIPLFEKNGFIVNLDAYVFETICMQQKKWLEMGHKMVVISVNMSRVNLHNPNFVKNLNEMCTRYGVPTKYFEIEITESVAFQNLNVLSDVISELKAFGFSVSIDDFGSGYSSLNMLKSLPVDVIKIDREFLVGSDTNVRASNIIDHVISLAESLGMETICEGIETKQQAELLIRLGCGMAQGFYFARPMPIKDYENLIYNKQAESQGNEKEIKSNVKLGVK